MGIAFTTKRGDLFPAGATVGAYRLPAEFADWSGRKPPGVPVAETAMTAEGASFNNLVAGRYVLAARVAGAWRMLRVSVKRS